MPQIGVVLLEAVIKSVVLIFVLLTACAYLVLLERKLVAWMQVRYGPNRVGPFGLLQPLADGLKLMLKEDIRPAAADPILHTLAPAISLIAALIAFAVIPLGHINLFGREIVFQVADVGVGVLYLLAISSLGVYGIVLAGWSSNNKYSLLGGLRSSAQMISYELSLGLSLVGVLILAGSASLSRIVEAQGAWVPFVFPQIVGFAVYVISGIAETNRAPFDLPEAEQELVAGYHTEYSGMKFALFFMAEYINMITVSAVATTLFLGGWHGPFLDQYLGPIWFVIKVFVILTIFVWLRATLPRVRYDRLMRFGWQALLPVALLNLFVTALVVALRA